MKRFFVVCFLALTALLFSATKAAAIDCSGTNISTSGLTFHASGISDLNDIGGYTLKVYAPLGTGCSQTIDLKDNSTITKQSDGTYTASARITPTSSDCDRADLNYSLVVSGGYSLCNFEANLTDNTSSTVSSNSTPTSVASTSGGALNICSNLLNSADAVTCRTCLSSGGVWTGLGCLKFDPAVFAANLFTIALSVGGGIAFILMLFGAFILTTASGNPDNAKKGQEIITSAIAGLLFIIFSAFLLNLIGVEILQIPGFKS